ncbi:cupin domain-containing protein [Adhaeribacter swui]|uniref:Cupin domain-containing protein n=1 Tax=Adhaeribacter swui TaxID=2086471 RepID=A0A7G7G4U6_9BACT|nr:cupin domain-containing protein [Adhaeribacter swui]QNF32180.1 cupin domain-containing protein [Adhaeribacter swui]
MQTLTRTITNPLIKDEVTFLKTSAETRGAYTLVEVKLAPGGGVPLHYHNSYRETFACVAGELSIQCQKDVVRLQSGQSAVAEANTLHRFFNQSPEPCRFLCRIEPGNPGFEQLLQINYGLARDGKTNAKGMPKGLLNLAYVLSLGETRLPGLLSVLGAFFKILARRAVKKGIAAQLQQQYVRF